MSLFLQEPVRKAVRPYLVAARLFGVAPYGWVGWTRDRSNPNASSSSSSSNRAGMESGSKAGKWNVVATPGTAGTPGTPGPGADGDNGFRAASISPPWLVFDVLLLVATSAFTVVLFLKDVSTVEGADGHNNSVQAFAMCLYFGGLTFKMAGMNAFLLLFMYRAVLRLLNGWPVVRNPTRPPAAPSGALQVRQPGGTADFPARTVHAVLTAQVIAAIALQLALRAFSDRLEIGSLFGAGMNVVVLVKDVGQTFIKLGFVNLCLLLRFQFGILNQAVEDLVSNHAECVRGVGVDPGSGGSGWSSRFAAHVVGSSQQSFPKGMSPVESTARAIGASDGEVPLELVQEHGHDALFTLSGPRTGGGGRHRRGGKRLRLRQTVAHANGPSALLTKEVNPKRWGFASASASGGWHKFLSSAMTPWPLPVPVSEYGAGSTSRASIQAIRVLHSRLSDTLEAVNGAFSPVLLVVLLHMFIHALTTMFLVMDFLMSAPSPIPDGNAQAESVDNSARVTSPLEVEFILQMVVYVAFAVLIIVACEVSAAAANRTSDLVHRLLNRPGLYREEKIELQLFSLQLMHRKSQFTACGFFPLDFSVLYGVVGAICTYLIILVQFQGDPGTSQPLEPVAAPAPAPTPSPLSYAPSEHTSDQPMTSPASYDRVEDFNITSADSFAYNYTEP